MPNLSIIPARAVMDRDLTPTQLRVLCAIGIHTDRLGGNVWTSVRTLAQEAGVVERTVQRACEELVERGYLRVVPRPGRTSLYHVVLEPPMTGDTAVTPVTGTTPPPTQLRHPTPDRAMSPERPQGTPQMKRATREEVDALISAYPDRPEPVVWPAVLKELNLLVQKGQSVDRIIRAAGRYRMACVLNKTEPQYVKSLHRWLADGLWQAYDVITVQGRTRAEWRLSGQDVLEFDRLAAAQVLPSATIKGGV